MFLPPSQLDPQTIDCIREVVRKMMLNKECFFLLDVTNAVKRIGYGTPAPSNFGSHAAMRPVAEEAVKLLSPTYDYAWALLDVKSGNEQAYLYFPSGTNTATIQSHVNRPVSPLLPVEVWASQVSQQASGVQSQAVAPVPSVNTAITVNGAPGTLAQLGQHIRQLLGGGK